MKNWNRRTRPGHPEITLLFALPAAAPLGAPGVLAAGWEWCGTLDATVYPPNFSRDEDAVGVCATVDPWSCPHPYVKAGVGTEGEEGFCILETSDQLCPAWYGGGVYDSRDPGVVRFGSHVCEGTDRACYSLP